MTQNMTAWLGIGGALLALASIIFLSWSLNQKRTPINSVDWWNGIRATYGEMQWRYNSQWWREHNAE
jgi:hypothetical protein